MQSPQDVVAASVFAETWPPGWSVLFRQQVAESIGVRAVDALLDHGFVIQRARHPRDQDSPQARTGDPAESHEAPKVLNVSALQAEVLAAHRVARLYGMTDQELISVINRERVLDGKKPFAESSIRTRRNELVKAGWVYDTGRRSDGSAVWKLRDR